MLNSCNVMLNANIFLGNSFQMPLSVKIILMSIKSKVAELLKKHNLSAKALGIKLEEEEVKLLEAPLADGSMIYTDAAAWEAGVPVYTKDADGNNVPAAAGDYTLADGKIVVVGEGGTLSEIKEVESEDMSTEELLGAIDNLATQKATLEAEIATMKTELEALRGKNTETETKLSVALAKVKSLEKAPAAPSVKEVELGKKKKETTNDEPKPGTREWYMQFTQPSSN